MTRPPPSLPLVTAAATVAAFVIPLLAAPALAQQHPPCDRLAPELHLPLAPEPPREVIQSYDGEFSHRDRHRFAWDFAMPPGTPILAAADGVVVEVVDGFGDGAADRAYENKTNRVILDHGNNRFSVYQHLERGAVVRLGERVRRGQTIGRSGNSGWTKEPHLHFHVSDHMNQSQPVCFADVPEGMPAFGRRYPVPPKTPVVLSKLPRDVFAQNGVVLESDLLSRWLARTPRLRITGRTTRPARQVAAWIAPFDSERASKWWYGKVDGRGRFTIDVDLGEEQGPRNFSMATTDDDGRFSSTFSVPVTLGSR